MAFFSRVYVLSFLRSVRLRARFVAEVLKHSFAMRALSIFFRLTLYFDEDPAVCMDKNCLVFYF